MTYFDVAIHLVILACLLKTMLNLQQIETNIVEEIKETLQRESEDTQHHLEKDLNKRLNELQSKRFSYMKIVRTETGDNK